MDTIWEEIFWGNTVQQWITAAGIFALLAVLAKLLKTFAFRRIKRFSERTTSTLDDLIVKLLGSSVMPMLYVLAFYMGTRYLQFPASVERIIHAVVITVTTYYVVHGISGLFSYLISRFTKGDGTQEKQAKGILLIVKVFLWLGGVVFLLDNLGYNITTIVTGLGIGGIAIALAAQAILGDLFSYLVIFFDKPFETGDFIVVGDKSGSVEYIGIKTTRLRTPAGEQLIMSNTDLTNSRVQNYKRMERRRVLLSIGVEYETGAEKLERIPAIVKEIIDAQPDVVFDRTHFAGFGDFSLNFEIVFYILTADYLKYMDCQHAFCMQLYRRFDQEKIGFAYPTQKLLLARAGA